MHRSVPTDLFPAAPVLRHVMVRALSSQTPSTGSQGVPLAESKYQDRYTLACGS